MRPRDRKAVGIMIGAPVPDRAVGLVGMAREGRECGNACSGPGQGNAAVIGAPEGRAPAGPGMFVSEGGGSGA